MEPNLIGQTLGKYRVLEEIGRGGMGVVYKAHDTVLDRLVAIKVLAPHLTWDQEFVQRFLREARSAARIEHPHIVTIYDVAQARSYHFIAMKYLEGRSLAEIIRREGPLPMERAVRILAQIAQALDYAHARGLIHRDVKPGNISVSPQDHATLTDFGIARSLEGTRLTQSGVMVGTPAYMSPEQVRQQPTGPASDVYALGVVAYETLGGRPPFKGDTPYLLYAHAHEEPRPLPLVNSKISPAVGAVVHKALAKAPSKRYGSAGAFAKALGQAVGSRERGGVRKPLLSRPPSLSSAARVSQVPPWPLIGGLLGVIVVVIVLAFALGRGCTVPVTPTPAPTVTEMVTETVTPTPTHTLTATLTPAATATPTDTHTVTPNPTVSPTIASTPPSTEGISVGDYVQVAAESGLWLRDGPGVNGAQIRLLEDGTVLKVIAGPEEVDRYQWWRLEDLNTGTLGWTADKWLVPTAAPAETATPTPTPTTTPTPTPTTTPTPTLTATSSPPPPTPTATSTATQTPTPMSTSITLLEPAHGSTQSEPVTFRWEWSEQLEVGQVYDLRVCKHRGCEPQLGIANLVGPQWEWCPDWVWVVPPDRTDIRPGDVLRWQVVVIEDATDQPVGPKSEVWEFVWVGECGTPPPTPTLVPTPVPPIITLSQPANGTTMSGLVTFEWAWTGTLESGETFDVKVCQGEGCGPKEGKTNARDTTWPNWCPDAGQGIYRWKVEVIDEVSKDPKGPMSVVWEFIWVGSRQRKCDKCTDPITGKTYDCNCRFECY